MPTLKQVRKGAWSFYQKWRKETTYSPALKSAVRISLMGWNHLSGSDKARKEEPIRMLTEDTSYYLMLRRSLLHPPLFKILPIKGK